jgi:hypothetical protein
MGGAFVKITPLTSIAGNRVSVLACSRCRSQCPVGLAAEVDGEVAHGGREAGCVVAGHLLHHEVDVLCLSNTCDHMNCILRKDQSGMQSVPFLNGCGLQLYWQAADKGITHVDREANLMVAGTI